jgi:hypothetical protein
MFSHPFDARIYWMRHIYWMRRIPWMHRASLATDAEHADILSAHNS